MTTSQVVPLDIDFSVCEAERIDAPGAIQGHGALFVLSADGFRVTHVSCPANSAPINSISSRSNVDLIGADAKALCTALGLAVDLEALVAGMRPAGLDSGRITDATISRVQPVEIASDPTSTWFLSLCDRHVLLERRPEPAHPFPVAAGPWLRNLPVALSAPGHNIFAVSEAAVAEIRALTGFDRVMVYRFASDFTGEVIAEARMSTMSPYLGLRYPATDIPSQARRMYVDNRVREIVDTGATPIPIRPPCSIGAAEPLDLSTSILRAISPYHLDYMTNMGVRATLVASIIVDGKLWGLLACHHRTPILVPASHRQAILDAVALLMTRISEVTRASEARRPKQIDAAYAAIARAADDRGNFAATLLEVTIDIMKADGAALVHGDDILVVGRAPTVEAIPAIALSLRAIAMDGVFFHDRLGQLNACGEADFEGARGAAGLIIPGAKPFMLIVFRDEFVRSVNWGGDPAHAAEVDRRTGLLAPRRSFAAWRQLVGGCSRPWDETPRGFIAALGASNILARSMDRLATDMRTVHDDMRQYQDIGNVVGNVALDGIAISVLTDCDDVVRMVGGSRAFARLFDIDPEECEGLPLSELTGRLGFPLPWRSPQANEVVVWSESDGPRNIVVMRRSALDTLIDGVRKTWEVRVFQDVTQARRREEGLAVAFEQALGEARGKAEFLANISHELRTPLNAVLGYAEVISGQMFGPDAAVKYSEYATDIHSAGAHLLALIDHLLMVSEIEAEKRVLHVTQFDLGELVAECARWVAEQPGPAKPEISVNRPAEGLMVEADAVAMYQVTINLIGNAAKFTPPSGHVSVTVMVDAMGGPVLSVKDDGPGVSPELIADLFQPFRQGEGVYARRHGGVGLGLSIVKGLIQLHGGTVRMISQLGHGAEVIARLPPTLRV